MEAVLAHAKSLGVFLSDPMTPADQALLEIAKESLTAPLPEGWQIGDKGCFVNKYNGDLRSFVTAIASLAFAMLVSKFSMECSSSFFLSSST